MAATVTDDAAPRTSEGAMRLPTSHDHDRDEPIEYGPDGYDRHGFNRAGLHRDTQDRYGPDGRDQDGQTRPSRQPLLRLH